MYSAGHSEICIGKALKKYNIPRHKVQIFTKCYFTVSEELPLSLVTYSDEIAKSRDYVNQRGKYCVDSNCNTNREQDFRGRQFSMLWRLP